MKNEEKLMDAIGTVRDDLIPELPKEEVQPHARIQILKPALGFLAAAAAVFLLLYLTKPGTEIPDPSENTETVDPADIAEKKTPYDGLVTALNEERFEGTETVQIGPLTFEGGSFEVITLYDISEYDTPDPWKGIQEESKLPVFQNTLKDKIFGIRLTEDEMRKILQNTADCLDADIFQTQTEKGREDRDCMRITAVLETNASRALSITVSGDGTVSVFLSYPMPSEYRFGDADCTNEEAENALAFLTDRFSALFHLKQPAFRSYLERDFNGDGRRQYYVYEASDDPVSGFVKDQFFSVQFLPDRDGNLFCILLKNAFLYSEYVGDYPVISEEEARALLLEGKYVSTVPDAYIGKDGRIQESRIEKTELTYRISHYDDCFIPYYKFYIALDTDIPMAEDLINYGIFYVPALEHYEMSDTEPTLHFN